MLEAAVMVALSRSAEVGRTEPDVMRLSSATTRRSERMLEWLLYDQHWTYA
jgi:hypothetical protein